jgi:hypothetical protein
MDFEGYHMPIIRISDGVLSALPFEKERAAKNKGGNMLQH